MRAQVSYIGKHMMRGIDLYDQAMRRGRHQGRLHNVSSLYLEILGGIILIIITISSSRTSTTITSHSNSSSYRNSSNNNRGSNGNSNHSSRDSTLEVGLGRRPETCLLWLPSVVLLYLKQGIYELPVI